MKMSEMNGYQCTCSCCTGSGCTLSYMGVISVSTCSGTTCIDNCRTSYSTCSIGSLNAVCHGNQFFHFYLNLLLIFCSLIFKSLYL